MVVNIALQTLSSALRQAVQCLGSRQERTLTCIEIEPVAILDDSG